MNVDDVVIYYYIVKDIDYIKVTKDYKNLYDDITKHALQLPEESQQFLLNYAKNNLVGCDDYWGKLLLEYIEEKTTLN